MFERGVVRRLNFISCMDLSTINGNWMSVNISVGAIAAGRMSIHNSTGPENSSAIINTL